MNNNRSSGLPNSATEFPEGDAARQAIDSLRGYAYQVFAAALAWLDLDEKGRLFLEVAEDYATTVNQVLSAVQVKDTQGSGSVTLNSENIRDAIEAFVDLVGRNPGYSVELRYFTTSAVGTEQAVADRPAGIAGLDYWRKAAAGADPAPLRNILMGTRFSKAVHEFVSSRDDANLRIDLLSRVHWDCGKPALASLRRELEARLVVFCREKFQIPADESRRLTEIVAFNVLNRCIEKSVQARKLTRAELYELIDSASRLSMPRADIDAMMKHLSVALGKAQGINELGGSISAQDLAWIIDGSSSRSARPLLQRIELEKSVSSALSNLSICFLVGSSGLGKSNIARMVSMTLTDGITIADFRDTATEESCRRLDILISQVGGFRSRVLIIEDLNTLDDARAGFALRCVAESLHRRDRALIVTSYRRPPSKLLAELGLADSCIVECPYFTESEASQLVTINGGDASIWGSLAYVAGAAGHPQLTHAFVVGAAQRGWPVGEIGEILNRGISTADIDAAKDDARRSLISALEEDSRNLLYRLSLTAGAFDRSLALSIGALEPKIQQSGECLDQLQGPWIESTNADQYRVSPLARSFGQSMLTIDEKRRVHRNIAENLSRRTKVSPADIDMIVMHSLAGEAPMSALRIAYCIVTAAADELELLAEHLVVLPLLSTDTPIFSNNASASVVLRVAQFKLASVSNRDKLGVIASALLAELDQIPRTEFGDVCRLFAYSSVLLTIGIANELENWIDLLGVLNELQASNSFIEKISANESESGDFPFHKLIAFFFSIGVSRLASIDRLERIIGALNQIDAPVRESYLEPVDPCVADYSLLINSPWVAQSKGGEFDAARAALQYKGMAETTKDWGIRPLTIQCWISSAIMLDEYQGNPDEALAIITDAETSMGLDVALTRARARILWRSGDYKSALDFHLQIADQVGADNVVDRAFSLREAAICAAKCGDWGQAEQWFLRAQSAAQRGETQELTAMGVGLWADAGVAALQYGEVEAGLSWLSRALEGAATLDPDESINSGHCHRLIRHAVLWANSRLSGRTVEIDGAPIAIEEGSCSNPSPSPKILEHPLSPIDWAWYMLAEAEIFAGNYHGIASNLDSKLVVGRIPVLESRLHLEALRASIEKLDVALFSASFSPFAATLIYIGKLRDLALDKNALEPLSGSKDRRFGVDIDAEISSDEVHTLYGLIVAFGIRSSIAGRIEAMESLEKCLSLSCSGVLKGVPIFGFLKGNTKSALSEIDKQTLSLIKMVGGGYVKPEYFFIAGLRFFENATRTMLVDLLVPILCKWQREGWKRIIKVESFRLFSPRLTVPRVEEVLMNSNNDRGFLAQLLLAAADTVNVSLGIEYRELLKNEIDSGQ